jgi:hypothetical protein
MKIYFFSLIDALKTENISNVMSKINVIKHINYPGKYRLSFLECDTLSYKLQTEAEIA